jgi:hypothetical protein
MPAVVMPEVFKSEVIMPEVFKSEVIMIATSCLRAGDGRAAHDAAAFVQHCRLAGSDSSGG